MRWFFKVIFFHRYAYPIFSLKGNKSNYLLKITLVLQKSCRWYYFSLLSFLYISRITAMYYHISQQCMYICEYVPNKQATIPVLRRLCLMTWCKNKNAHNIKLCHISLIKFLDSIIENMSRSTTDDYKANWNSVYILKSQLDQHLDSIMATYHTYHFVARTRQAYSFLQFLLGSKPNLTLTACRSTFVEVSNDFTFLNKKSLTPATTVLL